MAVPYECPGCKADLVTKAIPEEQRPMFSAPYAFSSAIGLVCHDVTDFYQCPHCEHVWANDGDRPTGLRKCDIRPISAAEYQRLSEMVLARAD